MGQFIIPVGSTVQVSRVQIKTEGMGFAAKPENEYLWLDQPLNFRGTGSITKLCRW